MGRKMKYSKEIKIKAVNEYLNGMKSAYQIENEIGCDHGSFYRWVKRYKQWGESIFDDKPRNSKYTKEFKLQVVQDYLNAKLGLYQSSSLLPLPLPLELINH